jgi:hypothetical protein
VGWCCLAAVPGHCNSLPVVYLPRPSGAVVKQAVAEAVTWTFLLLAPPTPFPWRTTCCTSAARRFLNTWCRAMGGCRCGNPPGTCCAVTCSCRCGRLRACMHALLLPVQQAACGLVKPASDHVWWTMCTCCCTDVAPVHLAPGESKQQPLKGAGGGRHVPVAATAPPPGCLGG